MLQRIKVFVRDSKAVSALEYALLVGIIAVAIGAAMFTFSESIKTAINAIGTDIAGTTSPGIPQTKAGSTT